MGIAAACRRPPAPGVAACSVDERESTGLTAFLTPESHGVIPENTSEGVQDLEVSRSHQALLPEVFCSLCRLLCRSQRAFPKVHDDWTSCSGLRAGGLARFALYLSPDSRSSSVLPLIVCRSLPGHSGRDGTAAQTACPSPAGHAAAFTTFPRLRRPGLSVRIANRCSINTPSCSRSYPSCSWVPPAGPACV